jgi:hypothetical protein
MLHTIFNRTSSLEHICWLPILLLLILEINLILILQGVSDKQNIKLLLQSNLNSITTKNYHKKHHM